jgi:hypothetical protein
MSDEQDTLILEPDDEQAPEQQATTTFTKDYLGRLLVTPATSGKDFLGRAIGAGDRDYLNRALI